MICGTSATNNSFHPDLEHMFLYNSPFKDARYLYTCTLTGHKSFNTLSIIYIINIAKEIAKLCVKNVLLDRKVRTKQQQNKQKN